MNTFRKAIGLALASSLVFAACGDDDDSGADAPDVSSDLQPYVDVVAADILEDQDEGGPQITEAQAECAAAKMVTAVGEDKITAFGSPEDLAEATADGDLAALDLDQDTIDEVIDGYLSCVPNIVEMVEDAFTSEVPDDGSVDIDCVKDLIDEDLVRSLLASEFSGDDESALTGLFAEFAKCEGATG